VSITFDHYSLRHNVALLGIVIHLRTESQNTCMFLCLKRVVSEDFKSTKLHIIETCKKFNLYDSIQNIGFTADGALHTIMSNRIPGIKNDIEVPVGGRCASHIIHRIVQERFINIISKVGQRVIENNLAKYFFETGLANADERLKAENIRLGNYETYTELFQQFRNFLKTADKSKIETGEIRSLNQYIMANKKPSPRIVSF